MTAIREATTQGLLTDLYELTMGAAYFQHRLHERRACFQLFFREAPFGGAYAVAAGLEDALSIAASLRFDAADIAYLAELTGASGKPLFERDYLDYLAAFEPELDIAAVAEGTAVFPQEPLLRVEGSLLACQLAESALLSVINFQTLVATKAARIKRAAGDSPVLEFGMRRAHGVDGGLSASRAAYLGGADATSNTMAGRLFGIPVRGTHAHSFVMAFGEERAAFDAYAAAMPDDAVFLVDTYDTLRGVGHAIGAAERLREADHELVGVRLDSGDLDALSREARRRLDDAGFPAAKVVASGDLDEHRIAALRAAGAPIDVYGVGTRLVTGHDDPHLGGVYKLAALEGEGGGLEPRIKISDEPEKTSLPGPLALTRFRRGATPAFDVLHLADEPAPRAGVRAGSAGGATVAIDEDLAGEALLRPVLRVGERVGAPEPLEASRLRALREVSALPDPVARSVDPEPYSVLLSPVLHALRERLMRARGA